MIPAAFSFRGGIDIAPRLCYLLVVTIRDHAKYCGKKSAGSFICCVVSRIVTNHKNLRVYMQRFVDMRR